MATGRLAIDDRRLAGTGSDLLVARMRARLMAVDLDCRCRNEIENSLEGFADENVAAAFDAALSQARALREAILQLHTYLGEIDELDASEPDLSAFVEMAGLFEDISRAADDGAAAMRHAANYHPRLAGLSERGAS